jgi:hypothetical protein
MHVLTTNWKVPSEGSYILLVLRTGTKVVGLLLERLETLILSWSVVGKDPRKIAGTLVKQLKVPYAYNNTFKAPSIGLPTSTCTCPSHGVIQNDQEHGYRLFNLRI